VAQVLPALLEETTHSADLSLALAVQPLELSVVLPMACLHLLPVSSQESTASLVVLSLVSEVSSLAYSVAPLLHLLPEQEVSFPMLLELLAVFSQASVLPLLVLSEASQVHFQVLSVGLFLESTVLLAVSSQVPEVSCPTLAALLVLFQLLW
jgi:hypothetical protein